MSEIICIDSSDDESPPPPTKRAAKAANAINNNKGTGSVVDLLDDDSDDDDENTFRRRLETATRASLGGDQPSSTATTGTAAAPRVSLSQTYNSSRSDAADSNDNDSDSDSDDSMLKGYLEITNPAFTTPSPSTPAVGASSRNSSGNSKKHSSSLPSLPSYASTHNIYTPPAPSAKATTAASMRNPYSSTKSSSSQKKKSPPNSNGTSTNTSNDRFLLPLDGAEASFPAGISFPYPPPLLAKSKQYPDLRPSFLLALWKHSKSLCRHSYHHPKLDQVLVKILRLSLMPHPLRSLEEFVSLASNTGGLADFANRKKAIKEQLDDGRLTQFENLVPTTTTAAMTQRLYYYSIPEALLVVMADEVDRRRRGPANSNSQTLVSPLQPQTLAVKDMWISLEFLLPEIDKRLHPKCPGKMVRSQDDDQGLAYYNDKKNRSAEMIMIQKLTLTCPHHVVLHDHKNQNNGYEGYIKFRKSDKETVLELLPLGYRTAQWMQERSFPAAPGHYRTSRLEALAKVDPKYRGICMAMDFREGGASTKSVMHRMCHGLEMSGVPYCVAMLDISDYVFFSTDDNNLLCPVLVERKSIEDLAHSIADGRWTSQKKRMYQAQYTFNYDNCRMAYIIEGNIDRTQVGNYMAHRKFNITREALDEAIANLEEEGFEVLRTSSPENSMFQLSRWAVQVADEVRTGKLKVEYTYEEFKAEVKQIPKETDFSRIAKYYTRKRSQKKKEAAAETARATAASATSLQGNGSLQDLDRKPAARPGLPKAAVRSKQAGDDAIDLCSDSSDDDDDVGTACRRRGLAGKQNSKSKASNRKKPPKKTPARANSSPLVSGMSSKTMRHEPDYRKASPAMEAHFATQVCKDENKKDPSRGDDSDGDSDGDEQLKKRKRRRESVESAKKKPRSGQKAAKRQKLDASSDSNQQNNINDANGGASTAEDDYTQWSMAKLKAKCQEYGLPAAGKKADLIEKLNGPKPPLIWLQRKTKKHYVPARLDTGATALLVALHLYEKDNGTGGINKVQLYAKAEGLNISKNPFSGGTTQTGPHLYDGWSNMGKLLEGEVSLVKLQKHRLYTLTRENGPLCGHKLAAAMHDWCHEVGICPCGDN